jgi:CRISPR-associated endonuclease Csn1
MAKILGLDLGTNSIGWSIRNTVLSENNRNQIEKYGVITFEKGIGEGKSGEFSFAAQRTSKRSLRRLYQARKYRLWKTLEILIDNDYCPLTIDNLNRWRKYDKAKALAGDGGRAYPVDDLLFDAWIKLDFDGNGMPDYTSPYQLREELVVNKLDLTLPEARYKLGRALYHIAQRRGFKSSRKDAVADDSGNRQDAKSEIKKESEFENNLQKKYGKSLSDFKTIGSALAFIEQQGERIRLNWIQYTFRKHYKEECAKIFEFQGLGLESPLYKQLIETSKNRYNGSIFMQRPLRSQKGLVGICTLEQSKYKDSKTGRTIVSGKPRCPISHPDFEEFRALSFINNIEYRENGTWVKLSDSLRKELYHKLFFRVSKSHFLFIEIREFLEKQLGIKMYQRDDHEHGITKNINYSDKTNVAACPVSARLKDIFGENWKSYQKQTLSERKNKKGETHTISYTIEDIWHVLFSFNDDEMVSLFATEKLELDEAATKKFLNAWNSIQEGYSMLSLHAIKKINQFLREGFIYTEAVLMANIPTIIGHEIWSDLQNQKLIKSNISDLIAQNRLTKQILGVVNGLTAKYKSMADEDKYGFNDKNYELTEENKKEIVAAIIESFGVKTWENKIENKTEIIKTATYLYQATFRNGYDLKYFNEDKYHCIIYKEQTYYKAVSHQFYKLPRVVDTILGFLIDNFSHVTEDLLEKLYHPSMIEFYAPAPRAEDGKFYLQSPKIGAFKNPMAMRTLFELRKLINYLIKTNQIDEETRIVVETARELNDANKRWAIETYQRQRQAENNEYVDAIRAILENKDYSDVPNPDSIDDIDKVRLWFEQSQQKQMSTGKGDYTQNKWTTQTSPLFQNLSQAKTLVDKYRLWKEQKCTCIYTGKPISITDLFNSVTTDFEHTIPRSISFDNSLQNLTVCFANYNRNIKRNKIPTELPNYEENVGEYTAIKPRLAQWKEKVIHLKTMVEFWKGKSKMASTKDFKDDAIRQRHLWQMELDYWQNKLDRFTMTEVKSGFKNSQLVDTQLISKYAMHYLRSAFNSVDVQKGAVTAEFRKILGIQDRYEKKSRARHSHHAIDATVLTFIPQAAKREKLLHLSYLAEEEKKLKHFQEYDRLKQDLELEKRNLELPDINTVIDEIDNQILINNIARNQTLVPGKKIVRKRGQIVYLRDKKGDLILNNQGNKKEKIAQGDCIRGQLHLDTFYGKIKLVERDENQKPIRNEDGSWKYVEKNNGFAYVIRKKAVDITKLDQIVDPLLIQMIESQLNGRSLKTAFTEGVYALDKIGNPIGSPIRHIRCWADTSNPLEIKKQTYLSSSKEYKHSFYAANAENTLYAYYWDGKSKERGFECLNLFQVASIKKTLQGSELEKYVPPFKEVGRGKEKKQIPLYAVLRPGVKVLIYKDNPLELEELSIGDLSKRLYRVKVLFSAEDGRIIFDYHVEARPNDELSKTYPKSTGIYGFSEPDFDNPKHRLILSLKRFDFIIEGKDFEVSPDGQISFK